MGIIKDITFEDLDLYTELTEVELMDISGGVTYLDVGNNNGVVTQTNIWCLDERIFDKKF